MKKNETCAERTNELRREVKFLRARIQAVAQEMRESPFNITDYADDLDKLAKEEA